MLNIYDLAQLYGKTAGDIDLERFFDTVNQDRLITIIGKTIKDGDVVSLIRKYLSSGVMEKITKRQKALE